MPLASETSSFRRFRVAFSANSIHSRSVSRLAIARDLEDPGVGEPSDEAVPGQGEVIERPGDPEGLVGLGPLPPEELLGIGLQGGEAEGGEEPALVEGAEGLEELEAELVREPVGAKEVLVDALGREKIGSRKGVTGSELDGIGKTGRCGHGLLRDDGSVDGSDEGGRPAAVPRDARSACRQGEKNVNGSLTSCQTNDS